MRTIGIPECGRRLAAVALALSPLATRTTAAQPADGGRVAVSTHHVLVVMPDGSLWCQGRNDYNQCAPQDSSANRIAQLTPVRGAPRVLDVSLSDAEFSLVLGVDGRVCAWGRSLYGVFGGGRSQSRQATHTSDTRGWPA
jgi:alpha-tubulin suppressor-like RCC1 family protein